MKQGADAVICGGGVMGCALAYELARRGMDVVLFERHEFGSQSTGRCAGGIRQQFSSETNVRLQMLAARILERFGEEVGGDAGFRQIGYLFVLRDAGQAQEFQALVEMWHRIGLDDARWVEPDEVARLNPLVAPDGVVGGTFCPSDGVASPADVTSGYAAAARRHGATLREGVEVNAIRLEDDRVAAVTTSEGEVAAPLVFDCAGPWSAEVGQMVGVDLPVVPYRRHVLVTGPFGEMRRDYPMTVDFATTLYFHPEGDGALLGMSNRSEPSTFSTEVDWGFLERMVETATRFAPGLERAGVHTAWAGLYETTPDNQAILGPVAEVAGFWCACGFSGHGFMQAPAAARVLAQEVAGETPEVDVSAFGYKRFARGGLVAERNVI
jgi:sarcosine oxidase subunit beta